jgi:hypothetical protein
VQFGKVPDVATLAKATAELLRQGPDRSEHLRQRLAVTYGIDPSGDSWPRFVNNHAWALVRLQSEGAIRKVAAGRYELAAGGPVKEVSNDADATPPIRDGAPLPAWARRLVSAASWKNEKRWQAPAFQRDDIRALWEKCGGRCMLTGLAFKETQFGTGKARKPYAPSLDRIDAAQPYTRDNCRLLLQSVNFALNAWGDEVFLTIAQAATEQRDRTG